MSERCKYVFDSTGNRCQREEHGNEGGHVWKADGEWEPVAVPSQAGREPQMSELERRATNAAYRTWNDLVPLVNFIDSPDTKQKAIAAMKMRFLEQFEDDGVNEAAKPPAEPAQRETLIDKLMKDYRPKEGTGEGLEVAVRELLGGLQEHFDGSLSPELSCKGCMQRMGKVRAALAHATPSMEGLEALPAKWRGEDKQSDIVDRTVQRTLNRCADELEAALARARQVPLCGKPVFHRYCNREQGHAGDCRVDASQAGEQPTLDERIWCMQCGKSVSSPVPKGTIVRAWVECPECIEKNGLRASRGAEGERLRALEEAAQHWPIGELGTLGDFRCICGAVLICSPVQEERIAAWKYHIRTLPVALATPATPAERKDKP